MCVATLVSDVARAGKIDQVYLRTVLDRDAVEARRRVKLREGQRLQPWCTKVGDAVEAWAPGGGPEGTL